MFLYGDVEVTLGTLSLGTFVAYMRVLTCWRVLGWRGGRLRLIALIEEAAVIGRILRNLGVPTEIPSPRPARAPPRPAGARAVDGWDDDS